VSAEKGSNGMLIVDGHCDAPFRLHRRGVSFSDSDPTAQIDLRSMQEGGIGASFFAAYVPGYWVPHGAASFAHRLIDLIEREIDEHDELGLARSTAEIEALREEERIAILIGVEGGHAIEDSLEVLEQLYDRGARYLTLTHVNHNNWADTSTLPPKHGGLTRFGRTVVARMNELGMLVDISHVSDATFYDALEVSSVPIIASHSSCRALADHPRNLTDRMLKDLADAGGICMINFFSGFILDEAAHCLRDLPHSDVGKGREGDGVPDDAAHWDDFVRRYGELNAPRGTVDNVVDHFVHAAYVAGVGVLGVGSDFDGVAALPEGLEDARGMPLLVERLLDRGFSREEVEKILGGNFMRVMREVEKPAGTSGESPPNHQREM
jgi:membrane dipeptidase